ncbi:MAG: hypothetical protein WAK93_01505 [Solirubrobacteraceae bacterium]
MDGAWLARARWRRRGAWLWPTFVVAVLFDAAIVCVLPMAGTAQSFFGGLVIGMLFSLVAVVLCSRPLGALLRRARPDLPVMIARDYGGTFAVVFVSAVIVTIGLLHHSTITSQQSALRDAVVRAEAFIGARAPAQFASNATHTDTYTIESGSIYRVCAPSRDEGTRYYCVIVKAKLPLAQSVVYAGSEPNAVLAEGTN